jgi:hypothetical protein
MSPELTSIECFRNICHHSVFLYVYPLNVARQRVYKVIIVTTNTNGTVEELLKASFPMRSVSYKGTFCLLLIFCIF